MGVLDGVSVVEFAGLGPAPHCAMLLAEMGAQVLRIDRAADAGTEPPFNALTRSRPSVALDLKQPMGVAAARRLCAQADIVIEGFRPGVLERLGLGPELLLADNPALVIGRATGWGQDGPLADAPGHDINYISISGALNSIGAPGGPPVPPLMLVGDFGGGALYLAMGVLAAVISARSTGRGQVVDAAMAEGAASLMSLVYGLTAEGAWTDDARGRNMLDGGAHYYGVYETADHKYVSIGALEPQFHARLLEVLGLEPDALGDQNDAGRWPENRARLAAIFRTRTRDEWTALLQDAGVCFAPVLSMAEAPEHPQNRARGAFVEVDGEMMPGPAPRFSRTPSAVRHGPTRPGQNTREALAAWGFSAEEIAGLEAAKAAKQG